MALNANAKKWVRALRSGKYKQGKKTLATVDGKFCCLGVACELAIKDGVDIIKEKAPDGFLYDGKSGILPARVRKWLGLRSNVGTFGKDGDLSVLNDSGTRFKTIANIIESEPEGLFLAHK